jgi:hypothetical protein
MCHVVATLPLYHTRHCSAASSDATQSVAVRLIFWSGGLDHALVALMQPSCLADRARYMLDLLKPMPGLCGCGIRRGEPGPVLNTQYWQRPNLPNWWRSLAGAESLTHRVGSFSS